MHVLYLNFPHAPYTSTGICSLSSCRYSQRLFLPPQLDIMIAANFVFSFASPIRPCFFCHSFSALVRGNARPLGTGTSESILGNIRKCNCRYSTELIILCLLGLELVVGTSVNKMADFWLKFQVHIQVPTYELVSLSLVQKKCRSACPLYIIMIFSRVANTTAVFCLPLNFIYRLFKECMTFCLNGRLHTYIVLILKINIFNF